MSNGATTRTAEFFAGGDIDIEGKVEVAEAVRENAQCAAKPSMPDFSGQKGPGCM